MTSDAVLAQINQIPKREYERADFIRELVSVKLKFGGTTTMALYPFVTSPDVFSVDIALDRPRGLDDVKVETVVSRAGKEEGRTSGTFAKGEPLVGRLVLKPGDYVVEATVSDLEGKQRFVARDDLHLKSRTDTLAMSDVLFFRSAEPAQTAAVAPFTYHGYRFSAESEKQFRRADRFQFLFQIAAPKPEAGTEKKLSIDYTIAALNNAAARWTFHDEIGMEHFDSDGLLLNTKTLPIRDVPAGRYLLIILVKDPAGHRTSQTVSFEVIDASASQSP
jgi:hypothetical protein